MNSKLTAALAVILAAIMVVPCAAVCTSSAGETGVPDAVGSDYIDDGDISVGGTFDSDIKFGIDLSALETLGSIIYATLTAKTPYESQIVDKKVDTVVEIADDKVFSGVYEFGEGGKLVFLDGSNMLIDVSTDEMSHYFGVYSATEQTVFEFKAGSGIGLYLSGDGETEIEYTPLYEFEEDTSVTLCGGLEALFEVITGSDDTKTIDITVKTVSEKDATIKVDDMAVSIPADTSLEISVSGPQEFIDLLKDPELSILSLIQCKAEGEFEISVDANINDIKAVDGEGSYDIDVSADLYAVMYLPILKDSDSILGLDGTFVLDVSSPAGTVSQNVEIDDVELDIVGLKQVYQDLISKDYEALFNDMLLCHVGISGEITREDTYDLAFYGEETSVVIEDLVISDTLVFADNGEWCFTNDIGVGLIDVDIGDNCIVVEDVDFYNHINLDAESIMSSLNVTNLFAYYTHVSEDGVDFDKALDDFFGQIDEVVLLFDDAFDTPYESILDKYISKYLEPAVDTVVYLISQGPIAHNVLGLAVDYLMVILDENSTSIVNIATDVIDDLKQKESEGLEINYTVFMQELMMQIVDNLSISEESAAFPTVSIEESLTIGKVNMNLPSLAETTRYHAAENVVEITGLEQSYNADLDEDRTETCSKFSLEGIHCDIDFFDYFLYVDADLVIDRDVAITSDGAVDREIDVDVSGIIVFAYRNDPILGVFLDDVCYNHDATIVPVNSKADTDSSISITLDADIAAVYYDDTKYWFYDVAYAANEDGYTGTLAIGKMGISYDPKDGMVRSLDVEVKGISIDTLLYLPISLTYESADAKMEFVSGASLITTSVMEGSTSVIEMSAEGGMANLGLFDNCSVSKVLLVMTMLNQNTEGYKLDMTMNGLITSTGFSNADNYTVNGTVYLYDPASIWNQSAECSFSDPVNGIEFDACLYGCTLGVIYEDGKIVGYEIVPVDGFSAEYSGVEGMTIASDGTVTGITSDTKKVCAETEPIEYTLTIDGEVIYDNITIGTIVYWADFDKTENRTLLGMVDGNGTSVGRVDIENGVWAYVYMVPYDLDLVTISGKEVTVSEGSNTFDSDAIVFQFPDTTENVTIGMDSGVVVELNPASYGSGDTVSVIVQAGTYNGYDAYLIEVRNGTYDGYATLYIPVDGDNYSLIHVADNGNVSKMYTKTVTIDGQMYLKVTANDFSVFYLHEEKEEMSETVIYVFAAILAIVCIGMLAFSIKKSGCS